MIDQGFVNKPRNIGKLIFYNIFPSIFLNFRFINMMRLKGKKVVVCGPECSGKSTLAAQLAKELHWVYIPEYARLFLEQHGPNYSFSDMVHMAFGQVKSEWLGRVNLDPNSGVVCDTSMLNYSIWLSLKYQLELPFVVEQMKADDTSLYLLLYPDIPWEHDVLRESNDTRIPIFKAYETYLKQHCLPYSIIRGTDRLQQALDRIVDASIL